jgi:outer membrane protein TolC
LLSASGRGLAAAEESYRVRQALFAEGRATSVELTDAETDLVRARLAAVDARIDAGLARVRLQRATGETP